MTERTALLWLAGLALVYSLLVITHWNRGYIDFGDGNYMYISWRVSQGIVLYRDVLSPQPPMHLLTGATIVTLASWLNMEPLWLFRGFSLLLHLATMLLIYCTAGAVAGETRARSAGVIAAAVYLLLPLGFWWSLGYQSEPLEMLLLVLSFLLLVRWSPRSAASSGVAAALAVLTNMTAAPYVAFNALYLAVRRRNLLLFYLVPVVVIVALVAVGMEVLTGAYFENVILNQVGSFPRKEFLPEGENVFTYALGKLQREGMDVLRLEGGYLLIALAGLLLYAHRAPADKREYVPLFCLLGLGSIIFVSKGGTEDYIFTIGEPFLAIMAGYGLLTIGHGMLRGFPRRPTWRDISSLVGMVALICVLFVVAIPGLVHSYATLRQRTYELDAYRTDQVVRMIERRTGPDDLVLAPPYYAFLARRQIAEEYSELFLWSLKYHNERQDQQVGRGVRVVEKLSDLLKRKQIALVVLDLDQTGRIPEIRAAIEAAYTPIRTSEFRTLNTRLMFFVPAQEQQGQQKQGQRRP
jgi:hypothetical protein